MKYLNLLLLLFLSGCSQSEHPKTEFLSNVCIKPLLEYHYLTCNQITFKVNDKLFFIPKNFETDLASIPRIAWPIISPFHSSLIRPAIVHDWFCRKTCDFNRKDTDLIFYHMLKNDGISTFRASVMYYAVRWFGWNYYNEDYCEHEPKGLDQTIRGLSTIPLPRYQRN